MRMTSFYLKYKKKKDQMWEEEAKDIIDVNSNQNKIIKKSMKSGVVFHAATEGHDTI